MADQDRTTASALSYELQTGAKGFAFFQAVRLLEESFPEVAQVGNQGPVSKEVLRFCAHPSLGFPASDIESIEPSVLPGSDVACYRMQVNFLGLYGPDSPLPAHYTEDIIESEPDDHAVRDFLDLFQHRQVSLFYRCWKKYRYYLQYQPGGEDLFSQQMFSLIGVGDPQMRRDSHLNWSRLLSYTGLLAMRGHSARLIAGIVSHYFHGTTARVEQCIFRRATIDEEQQVRLGRKNTVLGEDLCLGASVPDNSGKFRLVLGPMDFHRFLGFLPLTPGPMDFPRFDEFLPLGRHHQAVRELIRFLLRDQLEFDLTLILQKEEIPDLVLTKTSLCRLGWSTWLGIHDDRDGVVVLKG
ncbi:MAG: type VI secretion system baseplate subunit TssG [Gammaproteobacteria bacterium]|nr:type VI secretion system baseplate subunit TssG [Gammaproteobacteria bacterium]